MTTARPRLTFCGSGRLGVTDAICRAELGHQVLVQDTDAVRIAAFAAGSPPIVENGLEELLRRNLGAGRLRFTTSYAEAAAFGDVVHLCADTTDLPAIARTIERLVPHLARRTLIVGRSAVPFGTTAWIRRLAGDVAEFGWSPSFVRAGHAVQDALRPSRLVVGVDGPSAAQTLRAAAAGVLELARAERRDLPVLVTDPVTAELAKHAADAMLATRWSVAGAVSQICELAGADALTVSAVAGLEPGPGYGGRLPADVRALAARVRGLGAGELIRLLDEADRINLRQRDRLVRRAAELLGRPPGPAGARLDGLRVAALGITVAPGSDELRDSPALAVASRLADAGAEVVVHDPLDARQALAQHPGLTYADALATAVTGADLVCVLTDRPEFRAMDPIGLGRLTAVRRVLDGGLCLDRTSWIRAGWEYAAPGRPPADRQEMSTTERGVHHVQEASAGAGRRHRIPGSRRTAGDRTAECGGRPTAGRPDQLPHV